MIKMRNLLENKKPLKEETIFDVIDWGRLKRMLEENGHEFLIEDSGGNTMLDVDELLKFIRHNMDLVR